MRRLAGVILISTLTAGLACTAAAAQFDAVADAAFGDSAGTAVVADVRRSMSEQAAAQPAADDHDNSFDAHFGNHCADAQYPRTFRQYRSFDRSAGAGSRFGPMWWWRLGAACAEWSVNDDRYTRPWTAWTANPVLVVGNYFDGITDHAGAQASTRLLKNSRLLSYAGWGHGAYERSACVTGHPFADNPPKARSTQGFRAAHSHRSIQPRAASSQR